MSKNNNLKHIYVWLSWLSAQRTMTGPVAEAAASLRAAAGLDAVADPPESNPAQFRDGVRQFGPTGKLFEVRDDQWVEVK